MKRVLLGMLLLVFAMAAAGCGNDKPEDAVDTFFDGLRDFDFQEMQEAMAPDAEEEALDKIEFHMGAAETPLQEAFAAYFKDNAGKLEYEIKDIEVDGEEAAVTVDCSYVDGSYVYLAVWGHFLMKSGTARSAGEELDADDMKEMVGEILKEQRTKIEEVFCEKTLEFGCVNVDGTWYVSTLDEGLDQVITGNLSDRFGGDTTEAE